MHRVAALPNIEKNINSENKIVLEITLKPCLVLKTFWFSSIFIFIW